MDVPRTLTESRAVGRALRDRVPRRTQGALLLPERDPVAIVEEQNRDRLQDLVPLRIGRMLESPFAFYRGTAAVMAHDLRDGPRTGVHVVACGDAHVANFGLFASPERQVLFDLNDFDEASDGPWEWDVKRLAASMYVGGRDKGLAEHDCADAARSAVRGYRETLAEAFARSALDRYAFLADTTVIEPRLLDAGREELERTVRKARRRTSEQVVRKITTRTADGRTRIVDQPPVTQHVGTASVDELAALFEAYREPLRADARLLLSQFTVVDFVLRVVGVGSVGTRCYIVLLEALRGAARAAGEGGDVVGPRDVRGWPTRCRRGSCLSGACPRRAAGSSPPSASSRRSRTRSWGGRPSRRPSARAARASTSTGASSAT